MASNSYDRFAPESREDFRSRDLTAHQAAQLKHREPRAKDRAFFERQCLARIAESNREAALQFPKGAL